MANFNLPVPGAWYLANEADPEPFIVTACDERNEAISIQFEDGFADEIDLETWEAWSPEQAELPDHDFGCPTDDTSYNETVDQLAASVIQGLEETDAAGMSDADFAA